MKRCDGRAELKVLLEHVWQLKYGQLLIATTIAPTRAIRAHNNSRSPQRFMRVRIFTFQSPCHERRLFMGQGTCP